MGEESSIVKCSSCGAKNRIPRSRIQDGPVCGRCRSPLKLYSAKPVDVSDSTFERDVLYFDQPVLLDCWAPWCGPCRMVGPVLDELARDYVGRIKIAKLNVDENQATAAKFRVQGVPTLLFFKGGQEIHRIVGAVPRPQIEETLRMVL